jgi:hypothetical protein
MLKSDNPKTEKPEVQSAGNETEAPAKISSISAIGDTLAQSMPDVQEHAIQQEASKQDAVKQANNGITDRAGNSFDASIHKVNKQGEPTLTTHGNCILKPKSKSADRPAGGSFIGGRHNQPEPDKALQAQNAQSRASGAMAANLLLTLGIVIGGEEWKPAKDAGTGTDEKAMLESAFADYFEATGKTDLPPSMTLLVAIGAYTLPRFTMPKTQTRISKVKQWIVKKLADRKLRKHGLKAENNPEVMEA